MELFPSDLGRNRYLALLRRRAWAGTAHGGANSRRGVGYAMTTVTLSSDDITPSKHPFVPFWTDELRVRDAETRAKAASVAQGGGNGVGMTIASVLSATHLVILPSVFATVGGHPEVAVILGTIWAGGVYSLWRFAPRHWLRKMDKQPLQATEVESLLPTARGTLERQYLALVMDIQRINIPTETARNEVRTSLATLGEAVTALPSEPPTHGPTAVVYKNTLLQIAHLRDVVSSFDNGTTAAIGAGLTGEAVASIDRLNGEATALVQAHRELEEELGLGVLGVPSTPTTPNTVFPTTLPTTVTTHEAEQPTQQVVGQGTGTGANRGNHKWWQQKTG